jgi:hypothetical protein
MAAPKGNQHAKGRSNPRPLTDALRLALDAEPRRRRAIAEQLVKQAAEGNLQALTLLFDRLEGKAVQQIQQETVETRMVVSAPLTARTADEWSAMYAPKPVVGEGDEDTKPN